MDIVIRDFQPQDESKLNSLARNAFIEYRSEFKDWAYIDTAVSNMSKLAEHAEIFIAEKTGAIVGGVALVAPGNSEQDYFDSGCASLRMLVVSPEFRGVGIGHKLTEKCIERASEIGASSIGLYTSSIMQIALAMYLKMGFVKLKNIDAIAGVEYSLYKLTL